jgi:hypothetical protein
MTRKWEIQKGKDAITAFTDAVHDTIVGYFVHEGISPYVMIKHLKKLNDAYFLVLNNELDAENSDFFLEHPELFEGYK